MTSRRLVGCTLLVSVVLGALTVSPHAEETLLLSTILQDPDRYDGHVITVTGVVTSYRERTTRAGVAYTTFYLRQGRESVQVFAWPHLHLRDGLQIRVTGALVKIKTYIFVKAHRTTVLR